MWGPGLETRPHMFYQFAEKARNCAFVITDYTDLKSVDATRVPVV